MSLFDTCAHPTINGNWIDGRLGQTFFEHFSECKEYGVANACAVGMPGVGDYEHSRFYEQCQRYDHFYYPVAAITKTDLADVKEELKLIKKVGYPAVKLHPRLLGLYLDKKWLGSFFKLCEENQLTLFYCTYAYCKVCNMADVDYFALLVASLKCAPELKVVLLHGGGVDLLKYSELVRFNKNLLLDLSLTLMKYEGSAIDLDIKFLFNKFDQRISIGSDHPEWRYKNVMERVSSFCANLSSEKYENLINKNAKNFLRFNV